MTELDFELQALQEKAVRKRRLQALKDRLQDQRAALRADTERLDKARRSEQADVDRLEGHSLSAFFFALTGQKEERLDKERTEAFAAAARYDAAKAQLDAVEQQLAQVCGELAGLSEVEDRIGLLLDAKRQLLKESDPVNGPIIIRLEENSAALDAQQKEIREGLAAGQEVLAQIRCIESKLSSAEGWGTLDLFGGGMISSMIKHSDLDDAQQMAERLQVLLRRFRTELADVQIPANLQLQMDGFLRFSDCFLDNFFSDWAALDHIHASQQQVSDVRMQVQRIMDRLRQMETQCEECRRQLSQDLERLLTASR